MFSYVTFAVSAIFLVAIGRVMRMIFYGLCHQFNVRQVPHSCIACCSMLDENQQKTIKCLIYIGDAMEENIDLLAQLAGKLGLLNVPLFMFQERNDPIAKAAFKELSRLSGGAYSQFDSASADQLKDLLRAVAIYAAGGLKALQDFSAASSSGVKLIEQQLRK